MMLGKDLEQKALKHSSRIRTTFSHHEMRWFRDPDLLPPLLRQAWPVPSIERGIGLDIPAASAVPKTLASVDRCSVASTAGPYSRIALTH
jgi:hypothetical protein